MRQISYTNTGTKLNICCSSNCFSFEISAIVIRRSKILICCYIQEQILVYKQVISQIVFRDIQLSQVLITMMFASQSIVVSNSIDCIRFKIIQFLIFSSNACVILVDCIIFTISIYIQLTCEWISSKCSCISTIFTVLNINCCTTRSINYPHSSRHIIVILSNLTTFVFFNSVVHHCTFEVTNQVFSGSCILNEIQTSRQSCTLQISKFSVCVSELSQQRTRVSYSIVSTCYFCIVSSDN